MKNNSTVNRSPWLRGEEGPHDLVILLLHKFHNSIANCSMNAFLNIYPTGPYRGFPELSGIHEHDYTGSQVTFWRNANAVKIFVSSISRSERSQEAELEEEQMILLRNLHN